MGLCVPSAVCMTANSVSNAAVGRSTLKPCFGCNGIMLSNSSSLALFNALVPMSAQLSFVATFAWFGNTPEPIAL